MKNIMSLFLALTILISLCGCGGSFGSVNLSDSIPIPDDGLIQERILEQIQKENAIAVFTGESNGLHYEWTIFGSDIAEPREINMTVELSKAADGSIRSRFAHSEPFGFSALLSISSSNTAWLNRKEKLVCFVQASFRCMKHSVLETV